MKNQTPQYLGGKISTPSNPLENERNRIRISVIIPVYNVSPYVERCLKSLMEQTYPCAECIIVDDASPDDSIAKCERMIAGYQGPTQFVILHHTHNRGLSAARNTGTDAATCDYIFYLDSDDALTPDCLEKLAAPLEEDASIEIVSGHHVRVQNDAPYTPIYSSTTIKQEFTTLEAVRDHYYGKRSFSFAAWNRIIRKDFLITNHLFFVEGILYENRPWTFYVLKHLSHLVEFREVTYIHYIRPSSITTSSDSETIAHYYGLFYEDMAQHFTPGDEGREAAHFYMDFYNKYRVLPKEPSFRHAAPLFRKALADGHHRKEALRFSIATILMTTVMGRVILSLYAKAVKRLKPLLVATLQGLH